MRPGCFFSTGLLANLLGQIAGQEIAVMEVECRSQGDARCRFVFGGPAALEELFNRIEAGQDVDGSIAALT
ncbi:MAG: V4R domain-containing protein [Candidatus Rokuibacteriota bacterium]